MLTEKENNLGDDINSCLNLFGTLRWQSLRMTTKQEKEFHSKVVAIKDSLMLELEKIKP